MSADEEKTAYAVSSADGISPAVHLEDAAQPEPKGIDPQGLRKSSFDELSMLQALKKFRMAILYCFLCYTMSMLDGWAVSLPLV